jgi:two-component system chemotaxis sensor kinase CheA
MDDIQALLQAAFADELAEHLAGMRAALTALETGEAVDVRAFFRRAHSLKGAARAVGQAETERLAHALESRLETVLAADGVLDAALVPALRAAVDAIEDAAAGRGAAVAAEASAPAPTPVADSGDEMLRVSARAMERLTRAMHGLAGEAQEQAALAEELTVLEAELSGLSRLLETQASGAARQHMTRATAALGRLKRGQARARWGMDRAVATLEGHVERVLMVPAQMLFDGYERMVREVAESQAKQAVLRVTGGAVAADRRVLQALREPMLHMLRNAVGHGIEPAAARVAAGKPEQGVITVTVSARRGRLRLTVADDGAGLDDAAIVARARAAGLIAPGETLPPDRLHALLFDQGFSTARAVDAISGRGVGLSVVAEAARALQGEARIAPGADGGTVLTLTVPLSTSRQTVILFDCAGGRYALPAAAVARVGRLDPAAVAQDADGAVVMADGAPVPLIRLATMLGAQEGAPAALLMLHRGVALAVDALVAVRSLVVGDPGAIAVDVPLVAGTLLLDDGAVALLLGVEAIIARGRGHRHVPAVAAPAATPARQKTVLVVDDSITTRTLERGILEAAGYAVRMSVDGLAGLERLRSEAAAIDLVVADVEMPRMDGFGLLAAIRNDPALRGIPVVMMTSRNSPDDIQRGLDLGADAYCTKQDFEQGRLLSVIGQLI